MGLKWITGPAGSGKTDSVMNAVAAKLKENARAKIILIVPEQASFQYQYTLLTQFGIKGAATLEVLSFQRLARRVMQQDGGSAFHVVDSMGKRILLRRILQEHEEQFPYLKKAIHRPGYLMELGDMIQELKRYQITAQHMSDVAEPVIDGKDTYSRKLAELTDLYRYYEDSITGERIDYDDILSFLIQKLEQNQLFCDTEFWIDDFYDFTPQEYRILQLLMEQATAVHISLCLDIAPENPARGAVFHGATGIRETINRLASESGITIEDEFVINKTRRWENVPALSALEQHYFQLLPYTFEGDTSGLYLTEAQNRQSEADAVARNIHNLCRTEGYCYRDFAVLTRNDQYDIFLQTAFQDYDIPYFMDEKATLREHPLTELILGLMTVADQNWSYSAVFRIIKTGLLSGILPDSTADQLENYVLQYGIQGAAWYREENWNFGFQNDSENCQKIDLLRRMLGEPLHQFLLDTEGEHTAGYYIRKIYALLEAFRVPEAMGSLAEESVEYHLAREGQLHLQIWARLTELFDMMEDMLSDDLLNREDFTVLLGSAFESMDLGMLPSSLDQVFIGALSHSRCGNVKVSFVLGLNEGVFPQKKGREIFFGESERLRLAEEGIQLSGNAAKKREEEQFLIYLALTRASERLYLSWSVSDSEGKGLRPSDIPIKLQRIFPKLSPVYVQWPPSDNEDESTIAEMLSHPGKGLGLLGNQLRDAEQPKGIWADLYNWYYGEDSPMFRRLCESLDENEADTACNIATSALSKDEFYISVSGLESYRKCPYGFFLNYGLHLKERNQYRIEAVDLGSFYHAAMERFTDIMLKEKLSWDDLEEKDVINLMHRVVEEQAPELQNNILMSTGRYRYMKHKMQNTLNRSALYLMEHGKNGSFTPVAVEADFGFEDSSIPAFEIKLEDGTQMFLRGRIDRVEEAEKENQCFLRVVDYKSGKLALPLQDVYYGVKLQLIAYLQVMLEHQKKRRGDTCSVLPAAVLYYYFRGNTVQVAAPLSEEEAKNIRLKNQKAGGLIVGDVSAVLLADHTVQAGESSRLLPFSLKKGTEKYLYPDQDMYEEPDDVFDVFKKGSAIVTPGQMNLLIQHTMRKIKEIGEGIHRGDMAIRPYRTVKNSACQYCEYSAICRIGTRDLQAVSPTVSNLTREEIWSRIEKENGR